MSAGMGLDWTAQRGVAAQVESDDVQSLMIVCIAE
jgi:hypothetical protein